MWTSAASPRWSSASSFGKARTGRSWHEADLPAWDGLAVLLHRRIKLLLRALARSQRSQRSIEHRQFDELISGESSIGDVTFGLEERKVFLQGLKVDRSIEVYCGAGYGPNKIFFHAGSLCNYSHDFIRLCAAAEASVIQDILIVSRCT